MKENENNTRQLEPQVKAPDSIRKGVESTLNTYRLIGDVATLYIDSLSQTLIGFTNMFNPIKGKEKPTDNSDAKI